MPLVNWIHFSDFHLNATGIQTKLLRTDLKKLLLKEDIKCDYAFFSGDIRDAKEKHFPEDSAQQLIDICNCVGVPLDKLFIVPGNHDIDRDNVERQQTVLNIYNNKEKKGYYKINEGRINQNDINFIKNGEEGFIQVMSEVYKNIPDRINNYKKFAHFLVETDDFNIVHLDSTITYSSEQETDLVIGTELLYDVLRKINSSKYTIILSHYPFDRFKPEEQDQIEQILQKFGVQLWLCGHLHHSLAQWIRGSFFEFRCGDLVSDGGRSSILIGKLDTSSGEGYVYEYMWQEGDGWIINPLFDKNLRGNKPQFDFQLEKTDQMMIGDQIYKPFKLNEKDNELVQKNVERIFTLYDDRYMMRKFQRYGWFRYQIVAKALIPGQIDTFFITKVLKPELYSISLMRDWVTELSDYLRNYEKSQGREAIGELQIIVCNAQFKVREQICLDDFNCITKNNYRNQNLQLSFVNEDILKDIVPKLNTEDDIDELMDQVIVLSKEREMDHITDGILDGKVSSICPIIYGNGLGIKKVNNDIEKYYNSVWADWERLIEQHTELLKEEKDIQKIKDKYGQDVSEYTLTDNLSYDVLYNQNKFLSLKFERYTYMGGPHGSPYRLCKLYDLSHAVTVQLHEILPLTYEELLDIITEKIEENYISKYGSAVLKYTDLIKSNYNFIDDFKFYIDWSGLYIYFDVYEIGPYSIGFMDLFIRSIDELDL